MGAQGSLMYMESKAQPIWFDPTEELLFHKKLTLALIERCQNTQCITAICVWNRVAMDQSECPCNGHCNQCYYSVMVLNSARRILMQFETQHQSVWLVSDTRFYTAPTTYVGIALHRCIALISEDLHKHSFHLPYVQWKGRIIQPLEMNYSHSLTHTLSSFLHTPFLLIPPSLSYTHTRTFHLLHARCPPEDIAAGLLSCFYLLHTARQILAASMNMPWQAFSTIIFPGLSYSEAFSCYLQSGW